MGPQQICIPFSLGQWMTPGNSARSEGEARPAQYGVAKGSRRSLAIY